MDTGTALKQSWPKPSKELPQEDLLARLQELEETLRAIRGGEVDAVVVSTPEGNRVFTLQGADHAYRVMVEAINEGAATLTVGGEILYANRRFAEMLGTPLESLIGSQLQDIVRSQECPLAELIERARTAPQKEECTLQINGGRTIPTYLSVSPLTGSDFQAVCLIATDLTEPKSRETELAGTNELLKAEIAERKRAEEALRQLSGRLLNLQDDERRRIARDLHDSTAQTLSGLVLNLAYLQNPKRGERSPSKLLADSLALAEQAAREIRDLSHLLYPPALDQMGLTAAIRWHSARTSEVSGIAIELDLPDEMPRLQREIEVALFRVAQESLENVRRHSGSATASVRLAGSDGQVLLEVRDQGRGAPHAITKHDAGISEVGVGVAGMRERLRQLGGQLQIESGEHGTTVKAVVPLGVRPGKVRSTDSPMRVLVVDDSGAVRQGVRALLGDDLGLDVVGEAANGREAIQRAVELEPDLMILDIAMPELDGLEAARKVAAIAPNVRILAFSQDGSVEVVRAARKAGALGYVLKSEAARDLMAAVKALSRGESFISSTIAERLESV
jgi:PAS domain S-box-containing protein